MSSPRKRTVPALAGKAPVMMLNSVVLPQPVGPMMQRSSPAPTDRFTPRKTWSPPNRLVIPQTSRSGGVTERGRPPSPLALALRLDQAQILEEHLSLVLRLGDDDVEVGVAVFRAQPHHSVAGLELEAAHDVEHQHLGTRLLDLAYGAGEVLHAERRVLLAHDPAAGLLRRPAHRLVHLAWPHVVAAEHIEGVAVGLLEERNKRAHPLLREPAVADDVAAAHAALVVGRVEQRRLEALDGGSDGVAVGARDGAEDRHDLVTLDQLAGALDRGLGIGLVVGDDQLEPSSAHAAGLVGFLDREPRALHALLAEVLEAARGRPQQ